MPAIDETIGAWVRRNLAWSTSQQAWQERAGAALLLAGTVALLWFRQHMTVAQEVVLWGVWLLSLTYVSRRGWLRLFGPVLFYDLVRIARRRRYFLIRLLYVLGLTVILLWVYMLWQLEYPTTRPVTYREQAEFAASFFYTFMVIQLIAVVLLTPGYTAGAIADEKDRKTLEFLLATDLRNREIVLSKLVSRMANLTLIVLSGLPLLSFMQFFGGIDPELLLGGFAATGLTLVSLAAVSILFSVYSRKARDAIVLTYLGVSAYLSVSALCLLLKWTPAASVPFYIGEWPITLGDLVDWINAGNLIVALFELAKTYGTGAAMLDKLMTLLRNYAIFHGLVAVVCAAWAVLRLRAIALKQAHGQAKKMSLRFRVVGRPAVGGQPMLWKEVFAEPGFSFNWMGRIVIALLVVASFCPAAWILGDFFFEFTGRGWRYRDPWDELAEAMNWWARLTGAAVGCLLLLGVGVRAASSISGERDRQTLDGLLTTPLGSDAILFAKGVGSVASMRWALLWLLAIWGLGVLTGGVLILVTPLMIGAWLVYAAFLAEVGLWFSMACRTTLRATLWTLVTAIGIGLGHWLVWSCCILPVALIGRSGGPGDGLEYLAKFQVGLTPPAVLGVLPIRGNEFDDRWGGKDWAEAFAFCLLGLCCYGVAAAFLWGGISTRFRQLTGRGGVRRPEYFRPPGPPRPAPRDGELADDVPVAKLVDRGADARPTRADPAAEA